MNATKTNYDGMHEVGKIYVQTTNGRKAANILYAANGRYVLTDADGRKVESGGVGSGRFAQLKSQVE